jgi:general secretion pathway protein K
VGFAFDAHIEARVISYVRKRTKAEYLARSGIEIAELLMRKSLEVRKTPRADRNVTEEEDRWYGQAKGLAEGLAIRGLTEKLGDGEITLDIVPEPARRNINNLGSSDREREESLERILEVGGVPEEFWPELIESFLDWTDKDDEPRTAGAETDDYYAQLERPYRAKNGPLDTVEELQLVKGFTREIVSGGVFKLGPDDDDAITMSGIKDLLTVYGNGRLDVNAASKRSLMTLPGVDDLIADAIVQERQGWVDEEGEQQDMPFENVNDFFSRIPEINRSEVQKYVATGSTIYRITSVGSVGGVERRIWCIANHSGKEMTVLRWREDE